MYLVFKVCILSYHTSGQHASSTEKTYYIFTYDTFFFLNLDINNDCILQ